MVLSLTPQVGTGYSVLAWKGKSDIMGTAVFTYEIGWRKTTIWLFWGFLLFLFTKFSDCSWKCYMTFMQVNILIVAISSKVVPKSLSFCQDH